MAPDTSPPYSQIDFTVWGYTPVPINSRSELDTNWLFAPELFCALQEAPQFSWKHRPVSGNSGQCSDD